jgi:AcrR family transcriptional regulator
MASPVRKRPLGRRPDTDSAATRAQILEVATRHFARSGYRGTSVARIAEEADLSASAIFYHFGTKGELYRQVGDGATQAFEREIADALEEESPTDVASALKRLFAVQVDFVRRHPDVNRAAAALEIETDRFPAVEEIVTAWAERLESLYRSVIRRADALGDPDEDDETALLVAIDILFLGVSRWATRSDPTAENNEAAIRGVSGLLDGRLLAKFNSASSDA